ncbi:acetyl-CoA C-acetyltransferase [Lentzea flava]|uniref:Acetyl-CoA acetyltransferase n=1 Tax=Lentzea flava TaxID=103732 RepID=A0ABQ2UD63_9PSEU|nr:acetyl-CoA C-acetyltransferase [Lentzea flava]MCP2196413.1 acetyl-CoA C-acetyltransferase [Lentzea flava]GGU17987.1 acetyl-CoA acetyltransferase [Lentzea flava]
MAEAYIIEAVRTPAGRRGGVLSHVHPADLGAHVITALLNRVDVDPTDVDDVIFGCVDTVGPQAGDIARTSWLAAGFPEQVPGVTVDRQCGSSQQALHFAAQAVMSGTADVIVAGGVQNMSQVPIGSAMTANSPAGSPFEGCEGWQHRYGDEEVNQFRAADLIAVRWDLSRREMEEYALQSHLRAITAIKEGRFDREIAPVDGVVHDECPRPDTSAEKMAALQPLRPGGRTTAALSSQISDGASAVLVVSERAVRERKLTPRARVHHLSARGSDPIYMLTAPIRATRFALERAGMSISDIDLFEINEAFASVPLASAKELRVDLAKVNVNGGALALGHPIGATGTKLFTTLLHELERSGGRYGLQTMCEGGGQANVTIIERL